MRCMTLPGTSSRTLWPTFRAWLSRRQGRIGCALRGAMVAAYRHAEGLGWLRDSYIGEGQISYAGPGAVARGRLALELWRNGCALIGVQTPGTTLRPDRRRIPILGPNCRPVRRAPRGAGPGSRPNRQPRRGCPDRQRGGVALPQWSGQRRRGDEIRA